MIWLIIVWLGCAYIVEGIWYTEFEEIDWVVFASGPIGLLAIVTEEPSGICWNWITKPDLTTDLSASTEKWPPDKRSGLFPCLKCGYTTTDLPHGEPLCAKHHRDYVIAGGCLWSIPNPDKNPDKKQHRRAMLKIMGAGYVPPSSQNGQLDVATIRAAVAALKAAAPATPWTSYKASYTTTSPPIPSPDLPKSTSTEPIVGYRVWLLDREKGLLKSTYMQEYTWPPRRRLVADAMNNRGIHATKEITRLYQRCLAAPTVSNPTGVGEENGLWDQYTADVAGEVWLWGEVKEHTRGYTAQYAYPKTLWMPEDSDPMLVLMLEENYGVPVELRKEFKKHQPVSLTQSFTISPGQMIQFFSYPLYTACNFCGTAYDASIGGCTNSNCASSPAYNPFLNAAMGIAGSSAAQVGAQTANSIVAQQAQAAMQMSTPPRSLCKPNSSFGCGSSTCPTCYPNLSGAIVPYTSKGYAACSNCGSPVKSVGTGSECLICYSKRTTAMMNSLLHPKP